MTLVMTQNCSSNGPDMGGGKEMLRETLSGSSRMEASRSNPDRRASAESADARGLAKMDTKMVGRTFHSGFEVGAIREV